MWYVVKSFKIVRDVCVCAVCWRWFLYIVAVTARPCQVNKELSMRSIMMIRWSPTLSMSSITVESSYKSLMVCGQCRPIFENSAEVREFLVMTIITIWLCENCAAYYDTPPLINRSDPIYRLPSTLVSVSSFFNWKEERLSVRTKVRWVKINIILIRLGVINPRRERIPMSDQKSSLCQSG